MITPLRRSTVLLAAAAASLVLATCGAGTGEEAETPTTEPTAAASSVPESTPTAVPTPTPVPPPTVEPAAPTPEVADIPLERSITFMGISYDQPDLAALPIGSAGYWFAQFDAPGPVQGQFTADNAVDVLPSWIGPLNHFSIAFTDAGDGCTDESLSRGCMPGFGFRTFSQDGPAASTGGIPEWSMLTLPDGRTGRSGAIVDPHTDDNTNNTVNRFQLLEGVPSTFFFHVVVDNTAQTHDPTGTLRARANIGLQDLDDQVEPDRLLTDGDLVFNGVPDIYTYRFDGFEADDYIKLRLAGSAGSGGASFAGVLFDESFDTSDLELPAPPT